MKAEGDNIVINKLVNVRNGLNSLKTKVDDLDADKSKTVPVDLKELSDVVSKKVVKEDKLNTKVNNLEKNKTKS